MDQIKWFQSQCTGTLWVVLGRMACGQDRRKKKTLPDRG